MRFDIITLFPEMFAAAARFGVTGRMFQDGRARAVFWNPRDFATDRHRTVDDRPFGGGSGMVMKPEPLAAAIRAAKAEAEKASGSEKKTPVIFLSPAGAKLDDARARRLSGLPGMILLCGRYRGVDARILEGRGRLVDDEISAGDYVLSGGELAAMVLMDATLRHMAGALGNPESRDEESFSAELGGLLDAPCYTRPEVFEGVGVPKVLLSGDHAAIAEWRRTEAVRRTGEKRPDLLEKRGGGK